MANQLGQKTRKCPHCGKRRLNYYLPGNGGMFAAIGAALGDPVSLLTLAGKGLQINAKRFQRDFTGKRGSYPSQCENCLGLCTRCPYCDKKIELSGPPGDHSDMLCRSCGKSFVVGMSDSHDDDWWVIG